MEEYARHGSKYLTFLNFSNRLRIATALDLVPKKKRSVTAGCEIALSSDEATEIPPLYPKPTLGTANRSPEVYGPK